MIRTRSCALSRTPEKAHLHVVQVGDLPLLVADDWEGQLAAGDLVNVLDPAAVALNGVGREADQLHAALRELGLEFGEGTQLSGAHRGVVLWVGEEDNPLVANELVEVNGAIGGFGLEVGGNAAEAERLSAVFGHGVVGDFCYCQPASPVHGRKQNKLEGLAGHSSLTFALGMRS